MRKLYFAYNKYNYISKMNDPMLLTPSRKTSEHHGMADRKPFNAIHLESSGFLKRRLFVNNEPLSIRNPPIKNMRF